MLNIKNLHCQIRQKTLLQLDQLTIAPGEFSALIGPNGAGKTTLFKCISGEYPYQGEISFYQQLLTKWNDQTRARHLAVLPQSSQLAFPFSAMEVVQLGCIPLALKRKDAQQLIRQKMQQTDCWHLADHSYPSLSGGERQRVQLARILVQLAQAEQPPLLLLDEPTSAQDLGHQHQILQLAQQLAEQQQFAVVAILHDLNQVLRYCSHCSVFDQGCQVAHGQPQQLLDSSLIEKYWHYRPQKVFLPTHQVALI